MMMVVMVIMVCHECPPYHPFYDILFFCYTNTCYFQGRTSFNKICIQQFKFWNSHPHRETSLHCTGIDTNIQQVKEMMWRKVCDGILETSKDGIVETSFFETKNPIGFKKKQSRLGKLEFLFCETNIKKPCLITWKWIKKYAMVAS